MNEDAWQEDQDGFFILWENYDWEYYLPEFDVPVELIPECYSWYWDMYNSDAWVSGQYGSYIYQDDWNSRWLGADDLWVWDSNSNQYWFYWADYDEATYSVPCIVEPECYEWFDDMKNSIGWTNSLKSDFNLDKVYMDKDYWSEKWLGADDLWMDREAGG